MTGEVERSAMKAFMCTDGGIQGERLKMIESELTLRYAFIPDIEGKRRVSSAEAGDEVVLEGADGTLCLVGTMTVGGNVLH